MAMDETTSVDGAIERAQRAIDAIRSTAAQTEALERESDAPGRQHAREELEARLREALDVVTATLERVHAEAGVVVAHARSSASCPR